MSGKHKRKKHSSDKSPKSNAKTKKDKDSQAKTEVATSEPKNLETSPSSSRASRSRAVRSDSCNSSPAKDAAPWEQELNRRRKAGMPEALDFEFISRFPGVLGANPIVLEHTNLEEALIGPGKQPLPVTFIDDGHIDRWAQKDALDWTKGGDVLPNMALLLTLTNDSTQVYGATLVWVKTGTHRTTVSQAISVMAALLNEANGSAVGICALCDIREVPVFCPYPNKDIIAVPPAYTQEGVGELSQFSFHSSIRLADGMDQKWVALPPSYSPDPQADPSVPYYGEVPKRSVVWVNRDCIDDHGNTSTGVLITAPPDRSDMHTPRVDTRTLLPPPGFTTADLENRHATDTLQNLLGEASLQRDILDSGYHSASATSAGAVLSEAESGADGLPRPTTSFGEARRVLNLDIPGGVGGTNPNQMPEYVIDTMKNTIKAVTDAGSILWTGYGKVDAALREIASSTHSAASRPVVDHGVALQDALSAWCRNVQEVQESLTVPTQDNLTKALADTRAHFCELQGSIRRANNTYGKTTEGQDHKRLYSSMQTRIKEKTDPIIESTVDAFTTKATESLQAQLQTIGVSPGALVYLLAEMINTFRGRVAALVTSFSVFPFKEAVTPIRLHQSGLNTLVETLPLLCNLSSPIMPTAPIRAILPTPPASVTSSISNPATPKTPSQSRDGSRERRSSTASVPGYPGPFHRAGSVDRSEKKPLTESTPTPDTTTTTSSLGKSIQTTIDRSRRGQLMYTPRGPARSFHATVTRQIAQYDLTKEDEEDSQVEIVLSDSDTEEDKKAAPLPAAKNRTTNKRRHEPQSSMDDDETADDDHISVCSSSVYIDSDHQSDGDCPILKVPVKREPSLPTPPIVNDYDPDVEIKSDDENVATPRGGIPEKPKTDKLPETPRKKKKKEKKMFTPEESARILTNMRAKAYEQDTDAVKSYREEQGITLDTPTNANNHSDFLQRIRRTPGSFPSKLVKTIKDGREHAQLIGNHTLDHELEKLSGKAFSLSKTLREDPDVEAPVPGQYAVCFVRPVVGPRKTSTRSRVIKRDDADGFGHVEMIGLYGIHAPQALRRRRSRMLEAAFCPLCNYCCNNNYTMNNHIRGHYEMGLRCGFPECFYFTLTAATMWKHGVEKHGSEGVKLPVEVQKRSQPPDESQQSGK